MPGFSTSGDEGGGVSLLLREPREPFHGKPVRSSEGDRELSPSVRVNIKAVSYLNWDGEGIIISIDCTPQHVHEEDDEDSDPEPGDEEVDGFTEQEMEV